MKKSRQNDETPFVLRRGETSCHIVVTPGMHTALKLYADLNGITICEAACRLIQTGLVAELGQKDGHSDRKVAEFKRNIRELVNKGLNR